MGGVNGGGSSAELNVQQHYTVFNKFRSKKKQLIDAHVTKFLEFLDMPNS